MRNFRPGYLAGFQGLMPKSKRYGQRRTYSGLGAFGKGAFIPMPNAPPGAIPLEDAIDRSTGQPYMQDPRCPEGEKMTMTSTPCKCGPTWPQDPNGCPECCDASGCDPEGSPQMEEECEDDPNYEAKPEPLPAPAPADAMMMQTAPQGSSIDVVAAAQELEQIEQDAAAADAIVTQAPVLPPPSAYTGSAPPAYIPARRPSSAPSDQERLVQLVEQYQSSRPVAPRPVVRAAAPVVRPAPQPAIPDLFGWLRSTIFGPSNGMEGWTDSNLKYILPVVAIAGIVWMCRRGK